MVHKPHCLLLSGPKTAPIDYSGQIPPRSWNCGRGSSLCNLVHWTGISDDGRRQILHKTHKPSDAVSYIKQPILLLVSYILTYGNGSFRQDTFVKTYSSRRSASLASTSGIVESRRRFSGSRFPVAAMHALFTHSHNGAVSLVAATFMGCGSRTWAGDILTRIVSRRWIIASNFVCTSRRVESFDPCCKGGPWTGIAFQFYVVSIQALLSSAWLLLFGFPNKILRHQFHRRSIASRSTPPTSCPTKLGGSCRLSCRAAA